MTAAFFHAKAEYKKWYQDLQTNPGQLQVAGITNGHNTKVYKEVNGKKELAWGKILNIPGLSLAKDTSASSLKGGTIQLSINGTIKVGGDNYTISKGDVVLVDNQQNVHALRARTLNENEAKTVLHLLSLRTGNQPTETIKLDVPGGIHFGNQVMFSVPVFYNESTEKKTSRQNLIETIISFGSKNGKKGE
jgi:hypothetical protein